MRAEQLGGSTSLEPLIHDIDAPHHDRRWIGAKRALLLELISLLAPDLCS